MMNKPLFRDTNLNDYIKVKLTEKGINILRKKYGSKFPINIDDEGYTKFQMWDFARIFGEHLFMIADLVCQTSIQVQVKPDDEDLLVIVEKLKEDIVSYKAEHNKQLTQKDKEIENLKEQNERWSEECKKLTAKELQFDYMVMDIESLLLTLENKHLMTDKDEYKNLKRRLKEYHAIHHGAKYPDEGITETSAKFTWNLD